MGFSKKLFRDNPSGDEMSRLHRLLLLENGVTNYGGGIFRLRAQVCACRQRLQPDDPDTAGLLKTVESYLDGLITVSGLEEEPPGCRVR